MRDIENTISGRAYNLLRDIKLPNVGTVEFYIGGSSLCGGTVNDIDIFVKDADTSKYLCDKLKDYLLFTTKNASTFNINGMIVQVCRYYHDSLTSLVDSFDFAHIQVGAKVQIENDVILIEEVYHTEDWINSRALNTSWYCGSEYPLSSLVRLGKYYQRGAIAKKDHLGATIDILADILKRGYRDYDDFKNQLDAVDLGLLEKDLSEIEWHSLLEITKHFGVMED